MRTLTSQIFGNIREKCTLNGDKAKMKSGQQAKITHHLFTVFNSDLKAIQFKVIPQQTYTLLQITYLWSSSAAVINHKCQILKFQGSTVISPSYQETRRE